ncbi:N-acetylmuramoyl-L-alanine amidase [uncultured Thiodictyon sp.]|uniref:N-acetylmuramoyl-L-alanine amidase family protein n=1 Tax=uncultured Thiodictyon sp. TaxID=1846217 RepID=UPI0025EFE821|nr:N-acetylmuramoyl-L-alanine amidase [uncultured Thiodictyon sp.]
MLNQLFSIVCLGLFAATAAAAPAPACSPGEFVIALDVGHSLHSPGAVSARGVPEFRFNQELAAVVADALTAAGFRKGFVINADGRIASLQERVAEANRRHAELFLAIHHDSVQPRYLSEWTRDGVTHRYSDRFHGFSLFVSGKNPQFADSRRFANLAAMALTARGFTPTLHHAEPIPGEGRPLLDAALGIYRFDDLIVLKAASMPAVLLEAGVILNRDEERQLTDTAYRQRIAGAIVAAAQQYCSGVQRP